MAELAYTEPEPKIIAGANGDWEMVIGMEVHAQVASNAKLFSGASTAFGAAPNTQRQPGRRGDAGDAAGHQRLLRRAGGADRAGAEGEDQPLLALRPEELFLSRPAAGLPDQPALPPDRRRGRGDRRPRAGRGAQGPDRAHPPRAGRGQVDPRHGPGPLLRRPQPHRRRADGDRLAGPTSARPEEAAEYVRKLRQILRYLGTCDGNMQEGNLRADVNVSVRPKGSDRARHALRDQEHELDALHHAGGRVRGAAADRASSRTAGAVEQETRLYDPNRGETRSMRSKEEAHDYRYFPDPDLLPLELEQAWIDAIGAGLPELPDAQEGALRRRLRDDRVRRRRADRRGGERAATSRRWRRGATASRRRTG